MAGDKLSWTPEQEVALFHAMQGHKPVGINKHFNMICIQNRFSQAVGFTVSAKQIWDYLLKLYDIEALEEVESLPFSDESKEFNLPDDIKNVKLSSSKKDISEAPEKEGNQESTTKDPTTSGHVSHRKRGRRSSTGSASPVSSPSNSKMTSKRRK